MLGLAFGQKRERPLKVLCLGAHCDDIEIGCGGTILDLCQSEPVDCTWIVFCSNKIREAEARNSADVFLEKSVNKNIIIKEFRDGFLPYVGYEVKDYFEEIKAKISPDLIFTHFRNDKHQDHSIISELTLNTFRNHFILEYEIPKYDGDLGQPNFFIPITMGNVINKSKIICEHYLSQNNKKWFSENLFRSLMRIRGMEINSYTDHAEAFYCNKFKIDLGKDGFV